MLNPEFDNLEIEDASKEGTYSSDIKAHQLMVHRSQAMNHAWGRDKQQIWGFLTYFAIHLGATKFTNKEFRSLKDLLLFMANWRRVIGIILDHDPSKGMIRIKNTYTNIADHSFYKGQFPEILAQIKFLQTSAKTNPNLSVIYDSPIEMIWLKDIGIKNKKFVRYDRTKVTLNRAANNTYISCRLDHVHLTNIPDEMKNAENAYIALTTLRNIPDSAKRFLLNKILFYVADAVPLWGGSAAVAQMIYHSLERVFFNKYTYFGQMKSAYGFDLGMKYDIFAMLSPSFQEFEKYLTENILDPNVAVQETIPEEVKAFFEIKVSRTKEELLNQVNAIRNQIIEYIQLCEDLLQLLEVPASIPSKISDYMDPYVTGYCYKPLIDFKRKMLWSLEMIVGLEDNLRDISEQDTINLLFVQCTLTLFEKKIHTLHCDFQEYMVSDTLPQTSKEKYLSFINAKSTSLTTDLFKYFQPITHIFNGAWSYLFPQNRETFPLKEESEREDPMQNKKSLPGL